MNLKRGFKRIYLLLHGCWTISWLFFFCLYLPWDSANKRRQREFTEADNDYSRCKDQISEVDREVEKRNVFRKREQPSERGLKSSSQGARYSDQFGNLLDENLNLAGDPIYGTDDQGNKITTKDTALAACESQREHKQQAIQKRSFFQGYLGTDPFWNRWTALIASFVFLTPMIVYFLLRGGIWAVMKTTRWIAHGFKNPA